MAPNGSSEAESADAHADASRPLAGEPVDEGLAELLVWLLGSKTRARILVHLRMEPGRTSGEIADDTGLYPSTVRASVAAMHEDGLLIRAKRSQSGRGNNPYEYRAIQPAELVRSELTRLQDGLNAIYHLDRHLRGRPAAPASEPVSISVNEAASD